VITRARDLPPDGTASPHELARGREIPSSVNSCNCAIKVMNATLHPPLWFIALAAGAALMCLAACDRPGNPNLEGRPSGEPNTDLPASRGSTPESPGTQDSGATDREPGSRNNPGAQE
jgi:hypothetical protein